MRQFHVYILASLSRRLYIGVTSDVVSRIYKHKHHVFPGFTAQYNIVRLVYFETASNAVAAIAREKQLKRWPRPRKIRLIELSNPGGATYPSAGMSCSDFLPITGTKVGPDTRSLRSLLRG